MPIDLLSEQTKKPIKKQTETGEIEMHIPEKEIIKKEKARQQEIKKKELEQKAEFQEVNFMSAFRGYLFKKRLTLFVFFVIIIGGGVFSYFYFFYKKPASAPVIIQQNVNQLPVIPTQPSQPVSPPAQPPVNGEPAGLLPDTELVPLRGSVIKFSNANTLYLIEDNGELRLIDRNTVFFKNGQSINQISPNLIYTIADRYQNIRRGKNVTGFVDWDPRVLSPEELAPFL